MVDEIAKPLSIILEKSWQSGEVPDDWKKGTISHVFKKRQVDGMYRTAILTSIPGKIMKQILLETMLSYMEHKEVTGKRQHGFTEGKSCLVTFCDGATALEYKSRAINMAHLYLRKALDTVSHDILPSELQRHRFDGWTTWRINNWLDSCVERVVVKSSWSTW